MHTASSDSFEELYGVWQHSKNIIYFVELTFLRKFTHCRDECIIAVAMVEVSLAKYCGTPTCRLLTIYSKSSNFL